jgi:hypothetical protein
LRLGLVVLEVAGIALYEHLSKHSFLLPTIIRFATYGPPSSRGGGARPVACQQHKLSSHVDVRNKMCEETGCAVQASFGPPETVCPHTSILFSLLFSSLLFSLSLSLSHSLSLSLSLSFSIVPNLTQSLSLSPSVIFPSFHLSICLSCQYFSHFVSLIILPPPPLQPSTPPHLSPSLPTPLSSSKPIHNVLTSLSFSARQGKACRCATHRLDRDSDVRNAGMKCQYANGCSELIPPL